MRDATRDRSALSTRPQRLSATGTTLLARLCSMSHALRTFDPINARDELRRTLARARLHPLYADRHHATSPVIGQIGHLDDRAQPIRTSASPPSRTSTTRQLRALQMTQECSRAGPTLVWLSAI